MVLGQRAKKNPSSRSQRGQGSFRFPSVDQDENRACKYAEHGSSVNGFHDVFPFKEVG